MLAVEHLNAGYDEVQVLWDVSLEVRAGEVVALIGANGAGKSTLMMTVFGNPRAREGDSSFAGRDITALPTHEVAKLR
ncbi:MAG: ATP-binding cassette domain-containing protein, partial [Thermoanaerobaculales bacterium]